MNGYRQRMLLRRSGTPARRSGSWPLLTPCCSSRACIPSPCSPVSPITPTLGVCGNDCRVLPGAANGRPRLCVSAWLTQGFGGAGFSVPFGLLVAGVTIPTAFMRLIPKWIVVLGIAVAICGELSWLYMMVPGALPLVPLARFPWFVWIIAVGLALPSSGARAASTSGPGRA
jgi:hypothetical protein